MDFIALGLLILRDMFLFAGAATARMDDVTVDYQDPGGFKFHHADPQDEPRSDLIKLN